MEYIKESDNVREHIIHTYTNTLGSSTIKIYAEDIINGQCVFDIDSKLIGLPNKIKIRLLDDEILNALLVIKENREVLKSTIRNTKKTLQGWYISGLSSIDDYLEIGDVVDNALVDHFLNEMPPRTISDTLVQYGSAYGMAYDSSGKLKSTYLTFYKDGLKWIYKGFCFARSTENKHETESKLDARIRLIKLKGVGTH